MTSIPEEKVEMFITFFHSVFSAKENYNFLDMQCESPTLTNFSISNKTISNILANIDTTKNSWTKWSTSRVLPTMRQINE